MSRFDYCLGIVLGHEGGLSNHKSDKGGMTNYGVTQKVYDDYRKQIGQAKQGVDGIAQEEVEAIYSVYWKDAHCSYMPEPLDLLMFDAAVNHGPGQSIKLLQRALGIDVDGVCGRDTMASLHEEVIAVGIPDLCAMYLDQREELYGKIISRDPSQSVFAKGWLARVDHLRSFA